MDKAAQTCRRPRRLLRWHVDEMRRIRARISKEADAIEHGTATELVYGGGGGGGGGGGQLEPWEGPAKPSSLVAAVVFSEQRQLEVASTLKPPEPRPGPGRLGGPGPRN